MKSPRLALRESPLPERLHRRAARAMPREGSTVILDSAEPTGKTIDRILGREPPVGRPRETSGEEAFRARWQPPPEFPWAPEEEPCEEVPERRDTHPLAVPRRYWTVRREDLAGLGVDLERPHSVFIFGSDGVGKTHAAAALALEWRCT